MKKHICVATPMYGGMCTGFYAQSIITLQKLLSNNNIDCTFSFMFNESLITRARNALTDQFLKSEATHLMFIDADIRFIPEQFIAMLNADVDILCGIYPKKEINWNGVVQAMNNGVPTEKLKNHTGSLVVNLVDYKTEVTVPIDQPIEIWAGGTGFMLIKREVFEKLLDKVPVYKNNVVDLSVGLKEDNIHEFFSTSIDPASNVLLSEDYHFCHLARANGIKVHAAPWVQLAHLGSYLFEGGIVPNE